MLEKSRKVGLKSTEYQIIKEIKILTFLSGFHMTQTYIKQLVLSWLRMVHREISINRERSAFPIC